MMTIKKILKNGVKALPLMMVLASTSAYANPSDDWYVGLNGDLTWLRNSNTGGGGSVDIGYRFWPSNFGDFRIEADAGYNGAGGDSDHNGTHYFSYMGNLYYDFNSIFPASNGGWKVVPYIGGGLGDASINYGSANVASTFHHHTNEFAYDGTAGLSFVSPSMPMTDWLVGYRYLGTDDRNINSNSLEIGARFHF